jgi:hypothetical protein
MAIDFPLNRVEQSGFEHDQLQGLGVGRGETSLHPISNELSIQERNASQANLSFGFRPFCFPIRPTPSQNPRFR